MKTNSEIIFVSNEHGKGRIYKAYKYTELVIFAAMHGFEIRLWTHQNEYYFVLLN